MNKLERFVAEKKKSWLRERVILIWLRDTQHNDTQHNDTQYNDTQYNDTQHNDTQHRH